MVFQIARRTLAAQVKQQATKGADLHQEIADAGDVIIGAENADQNSGYENKSEEPFQSQYDGVIPTRDAYAFIYDLFDVPESRPRGGLRLLPRNIWPAMFFGQQVKMELQFFFYCTVDLPAVQTSKWPDKEVHCRPFNCSRRSPEFGRWLAIRAPSWRVPPRAV